MAASNKEISNILQALAEAKPGESMALATVVDVDGASYRRTGARMLIRQDGQWTGAISGGCLEGNALRRARDVMQSGQSQLVTYDTRTDESAKAIGASLGCKGVIKVRIAQVDTGVTELLQTIKEGFAGSKRRWLARLLEGPTGPDFSKSAWLDEAPLLGGYLRREEGLQRIDFQGHDCLFAVECVVPAIRLLLFGGGQDAEPLTALAQQLGWRITVTDDCAAKALPVRFPHADEVLQLAPENAVAALAPDEFTAVVLISHNYGYDKTILSELLAFDLPYIGILGPAKRFQRLNKELGGRPATHPGIYAPVGLDIGAQTPFEIAMAICAEIQTVFSERNGGFLRDRKGFIHPRKASSLPEPPGL